jgi:hypothetical protein
VNYCDLNWITQKESLSSFIDIWDSVKHQTAQWYIKLNVIAAFHKIWIAEDKWKTAFCTRYRLYEWMMTSFELVNALSIFQRYINWVLQNFLNEFCSAYVNNILIFTDESASTPKSCTKDTTMTLRSRPTNWHWQMWVWSQVNQVSRVHSESEKDVQMNSQRWRQSWTDKP